MHIHIPYVTFPMYKCHGRQQLLRNMAKVTRKKGAIGKNEITHNIFKIMELPPSE